MSKGNPLPVNRTALAVLLLGVSPHVLAQSPYGLAARQTIPWVIDQLDERGPVWDTEINVHNPGSAPITVRPTYLGAFMTPNAGSLPCTPQTIGPKETAEFTLRAICPLSQGLNFGRLELTALTPGPASLDPNEPSDQIFLASARVTQLGGSLFAVEGFPEGNLSGNKSSAVATGLKSGSVNGSQWRTFCAAAGLNGPTAVIIHLVDGNGNAIGVGTAAPLDHPSGIEMQAFADVFAAVGAPPGNYDNVTALFTNSAPAAGVFGVCMIVNVSANKTAFEVAKYLDNNDEGREYLTTVSTTAYGAGFGVVSEIPHPNKPVAFSNLHVAYFQHPDRVHCTVRHQPTQYGHATFDQVQMRLIDPDGQVVAGGPHQQFFTVDGLGEKPERHSGRNGRWLVEVAPDRAWPKNCGGGLGLCVGGLETTLYSLTCASGNGHNQLDPIGNCQMACHKDGKKEFLCDFDSPFDPTRCQAF
jgi:hypothetical protein